MPYSIILTAEKQDEVQLVEVKEVLESIPGKYLEYQLKKGSKGPFIPSREYTAPLSELEFLGGCRSSEQDSMWGMNKSWYF